MHPSTAWNPPQALAFPFRRVFAVARKEAAA